MNGWWIALILIVWALLIVVAGIAFIVWRAVHAAHLLKNLKRRVSAISQDISAIKNTSREYEKLALSVPLKETSMAYSDAYGEVLKKKEKRSQAYKAIWDVWSKQEPTESTDMRDLQDLIQKITANNEQHIDEQKHSEHIGSDIK